ncbi:hypothetical protein F5Y03DRAFT_380475, partial [Xylaria venustula]
MNPRSLKAHIDRAIEQSNNEHIVNIKVVSSNQLKSGDLSIKTATTKEVETLRQFAEDWTYRIGNRASVQLPTYGVLVHGILDANKIIDEGLIWQGQVFECELYNKGSRLKQCFQ